VRLAIAVFLTACGVSAASLDGRNIHYTVSGRPGKTVVLIHGEACDETVWQAQVAALRQSYRVVTMDLPGHGQSDPAATPLGQYVFTQAVETVLDELKVGRAVLAGHGMGGFVARRFAQLDPKRAAALVVIDAPFLVASAKFGEMARQFRGPDGLAAREQAIGYLFNKQSGKELQRRLTEMMMKAPERTVVESYASMEDFGDGWEAAVDTPTLALATGSGIMGGPESLQKFFTDVEYYLFTGAGHFLMLERPDAVNRLLLEFLRRVKW